MSQIYKGERTHKTIVRTHTLDVNLRADLDTTIFAYNYCVLLAYVMTSRQIVSCKLDPRHPYDRCSRLEQCHTNLKCARIVQ